MKQEYLEGSLDLWAALIHEEERVFVMNDVRSLEKATFAGGCFWCIQHEFDQVLGVVKTTVGYTGGILENPSYRQVSSGKTGHVEAILLEYDPLVVSYQRLLEIYWKSIDPTNAEGQFCDIGTQYRPVIFYHTPEQKREAEESKTALMESGRFDHVAVRIVPASPFYPAERYHQRYYERSPTDYERYHQGSGRVLRLKQLWSK